MEPELEPPVLTVADLPPEVWAIVCDHLAPPDLHNVAHSCWFFRLHALGRVKHRTVRPLGLVSAPRGMRQVLKQLTTQYVRLRSLDLTSWDNLSEKVLRELPPTLLSLNLAYTTIASAPGINVLSATIQCLNLHYANISRKAIKKLAHLTALRQLNMSHCKEMTAALLKYIPDTVEELDLSYCPKLEFEGRAKYTVYLSLMWHHTALEGKWPSGLRSLKLTGIKSATAALFSLPPTVRELDLSDSEFTFARFDFQRYLPELETLKAEDIPQFNCSSEKLWMLPDGLKSLSLQGSSADPSNLKYLPTSITSLNLANTLVTEYCSLYAQDKINFFFKDIERCMPNLQHLDLRCGYPYGSLKYGPCLRDKVATLVLDQPLDPFAVDTLADVSDELRWRPRQECEEWRKHVELCAAERECVKLQPIDDSEDQKSSDEDEDEEDGVIKGTGHGCEVASGKHDDDTTTTTTTTTTTQDLSGESGEDDDLANTLGCLLSV